MTSAAGKAVAAPATLRLDRLLVWSLSAVTALAVLAIGRIIWFDDSWTFFTYAYGLGKGHIDPELFWRGPVYAAMVLGSGALNFGTIAPLLLMQAGLAIVTPILIFEIVAPAGRFAALAAALIAIASLTPYANMTVIYHDQLIVTGLLAATLLVSRITANRASPLEVYGLAALILALAWIRPSLLVIAPAALVALAMNRRWLRDAAIAGAACLVGAFAFGQWAQGGAPEQSAAARQAFFVTYLSSGGLGRDGAVAEARARLAADLSRLADLQAFAEAAPQAGLQADPVALADAVFDHPDTRHFWSLWALASRPDGADWDALMMRVAIEQTLQRPLHAAAGVSQRYLALAIGPAWRFSGDRRVEEPPAFWPAWASASQPAPINAIAPRWMEHRGGDVTWLGRTFASINAVILPGAFLLMLVGAAGFVRAPGRQRIAALSILGIHTACLVAMAMLVDPQVRYQIEFAPLALAGAGVGLAWIAQATGPWLARQGAGPLAALPAVTMPEAIARRPRIAAAGAILIWAGIFLVVIDGMAPR